jgi:hypothetical protein
MKRIPLGLQTFRKLIEGNYIYVDKTEFVHNIIKNENYVFLSRPRRFGKSLLLDTIKEAFSGERELFKGLYLDSSDYEFVKHPVLRLDMSNIANDTPEILSNNLSYELESQFENEDLTVKYDSPSYMFKSLIKKLHDKYNKQVVILIDEYDKPILDHLTNIDKAEANREIIRNFYGVLKSMDAYIKLVFITGVSKFSKTAIFSGLNNLNDITLSEKYANICGIAIEDMNKYFGEHIKELSKLEIFSTIDCLHKQILKWYDGYSWDGINRVINPYSLLGFLVGKRFKGFWYETGTPTFLLKILKNDPKTFLSSQPIIMREKAIDTFDVHNIFIEPLFFQTGYLTVKEIYYSNGIASYALDVPNNEVREALYMDILAQLTETGDVITDSAYIHITRALESGDLEIMLTQMKSLFSAIPYNLHIEREAYYHSIFYAMLNMLGFKIDAEVSTSRGRIDATIEVDDKVYIMEFKYKDCALDATDEEKRNLFDTALDEGISQIINKGYTDKYKGSGKKIYTAVFVFLGRDEIEMRYQ